MMEDTPDLFSSMIDHGQNGSFIKTHARAADPSTSKAAAASVEAHVTKVQQRVLEIHAENPDGLTDEELTALYRDAHGPTGQSSIRSRRHDLTLKGKFHDTTLRRQLVSGRYGIVWQLSKP